MSKNGSVKIDRSRVISYDDSDPRYNLNIEDSDELVRNIYPLHFSKKCHDSDEYENLVEYEYPLISRCWGERYENCAKMNRQGLNRQGLNRQGLNRQGLNRQCTNPEDDTESGSGVIEAGGCSCAKCVMNLYGPIEDTLGYARIDLTRDSHEASHKEELNRSDFKGQYRSSIYDQTRILKTDGLEINNHEPDLKAFGTSQSVNKAGNGLEYNYELDDKYANHRLSGLSDQKIEPFMDNVTSGIGSGIESCLGLCIPGDVADDWGYSTLCCTILGLFIYCAVSNAFIPGLSMIAKPSIAPYICITAIVIFCICGSSTYSFFTNNKNLPGFMKSNCK